MRKPLRKSSHLQLVPSLTGVGPAAPPTPSLVVVPLWRRVAARIPWGMAITALGVGALWLMGHGRGNPARAQGSPAVQSDEGAALASEVLGSRFGSAEVPQSVGEGETVPGAEALSFTLHNRTGSPCWFMVFGVDAAQRLHFFYPAVEVDSATDGLSLPLMVSRVASLPQPISLGKVAPGALQVVTLFTPDAVSVGAIREAHVRGGLDAVREASHAMAMSVHPLEVGAP